MGTSPISNTLKKYGIHPTTVRAHSGIVAKGYKKEDFTEAFTRYVPLPPISTRNNVTTVDTPTFAGISLPLHTPYHDHVVTDENPRKPLLIAGCNVVTDKTTPQRANSVFTAEW